MISVKMGDYGAAYGHIEEGLALCRASGHEEHRVELLETFALLTECRQQPERAAHFYGAAEAARKRLNRPLYPAQQEARDADSLRLRASLGEAAFTEAYVTGQQMSLDYAIAQALACAGL